MSKPAIVLDTNVFISAALFPKSRFTNLLALAFEHFDVVASRETWGELAQILLRPKFEVYLDLETRRAMFEIWTRAVSNYEVNERYSICRDPKDNKFLELCAVSRAQYFVSGDQDLLVLGTFKGCEICTPQQFLTQIFH